MYCIYRALLHVRFFEFILGSFGTKFSDVKIFKRLLLLQLSSNFNYKLYRKYVIGENTGYYLFRILKVHVCGTLKISCGLSYIAIIHNVHLSNDQADVKATGPHYRFSTAFASWKRMVKERSGPNRVLSTLKVSKGSFVGHLVHFQLSQMIGRIEQNLCLEDKYLLYIKTWYFKVLRSFWCHSVHFWSLTFLYLDKGWS